MLHHPWPSLQQHRKSRRLHHVGDDRTQKMPLPHQCKLGQWYASAAQCEAAAFFAAGVDATMQARILSYSMLRAGLNERKLHGCCGLHSPAQAIPRSQIILCCTMPKASRQLCLHGLPSLEY